MVPKRGIPQIRSQFTASSRVCGQWPEKSGVCAKSNDGHKFRSLQHGIQPGWRDFDDLAHLQCYQVGGGIHKRQKQGESPPNSHPLRFRESNHFRESTCWRKRATLKGRRPPCDVLFCVTHPQQQKSATNTSTDPHILRREFKLSALRGGLCNSAQHQIGHYRSHLERFRHFVSHKEDHRGSEAFWNTNSDRRSSRSGPSSGARLGRPGGRLLHRNFAQMDLCHKGSRHFVGRPKASKLAEASGEISQLQQGLSGGILPTGSRITWNCQYTEPIFACSLYSAAVNCFFAR